MAEPTVIPTNYGGLDRYLSEKTPGLYDLLMSLPVAGDRRAIPNRDIDTPIPATPVTAPPTGQAVPIQKAVKPTQQPEQDLGELYHTVKDKSGTTVTLFSANGELKSDEDFGVALKNHNAGKETPGFIIKPTGGFQEVVRRGIVQGTRETLPAAGEAVGGVLGKAASLSPMLALAQKAGLIGRQQGITPEGVGRTAGRAIADVVGQQVDTPGEVGMLAGTALAAPLMAPVAGAGTAVGAAGRLGSQELLKMNLLRNALGTGVSAVGFSTGAKALTGEKQTLVEGAQEFATAATAAGLQGVASYWLTRILKPDTATKVATEMMDTIKKKYPTLINDENAFNIANASPKDISNLTSMMSKALRGDAGDEAANFVATLKTTLPSVPTVAQQNTLRSLNRKVIEAQNKALDNIGDKTKFDEALPDIQGAKTDLINYVRSLYPKVKNLDPAITRVEAALAEQSDFADTFREGAKVLHHLKMSGAGDKFDAMQFAQRVRGEYTKDSGSLLNQVGKILGQGKSLKDMPLPEAPKPTPSPGQQFGQDIMGFIKKASGINAVQKMARTNTTPTPWGVTPLTSGQKASSFAAQEAGQAAMKDFIESTREKKWKVTIE